MGQRARGIGGAALVALVVVAGCNRVPAEEGLAEAEQTLVAARRALPPEDVSSFEQALDQARAALAEGRYTDSLRITQDLPLHIHAAISQAAARAAPVEETPPPEPGPSLIQPPIQPTPTPAPAAGTDVASPASGS